MEWLNIVDEEGNITGSAPRSEIHGNNSLLHRVVHIFVFNDRNDLILQKRSMKKDVAPGKWDTSVGGHVDLDETVEEAVLREMEEELGIAGVTPSFMYSYIHRNDYESELVFSYKCLYAGKIVFNEDEIDTVKGWSAGDIQSNLGKGIFSDNFEDEYNRYSSYI